MEFPMSQPLLRVDGEVSRPLELSFEDLKAFPEADQVQDVSRFHPARIGGAEPRIGRLDVAAADALVNPTDPTDLRSLENGERQYAIFCGLCHGATGMGDGPVSATGEQLGPFGGVFPLVGLTTSRSDGYLYNAIRLGGAGTPGFRMPSYHRIPSRDRWDIVNYVRYLDRKGGRP